MAESFPFKLITPTGVVMDTTVEQVIGRSQLGEFGVLAHHIDFITSLIPSVLRVRASSGRESDYVVMGGFAAVKGGQMTILAPDLEMPEKIERAAAADEAQAAEEQLGHTSFYDSAYGEAEHALQLARARQQAAEMRGPSR